MSTLRFDPSSPFLILDTEIKTSLSTIARLVFDTGASYVAIPWKLTTAIGIPINPRNTVQITTATAVERVPAIVVPEMSVLGKTVKNVEAIVKDLPPESPADGLLGLSFLRHFKVTIDFQKGVFSLE